LVKAEQAPVAISSVPASLTYLSSDDLDASGGSGTGGYGYEVEDPDTDKGEIVNVDDIRALSGTGTVRVRAYREADDNYNIKPSDWSSPITLQKAEQAAVFVSSVPASLTYLSSDDLDASGGSGTGGYGYEVSAKRTPCGQAERARGMLRVLFFDRAAVCGDEGDGIFLFGGGSVAQEVTPVIEGVEVVQGAVGHDGVEDAGTPSG